MNFRNVLIALTCLALFAGLASAQWQIPNQIPCTVTAQSVQGRAEGVAEKVGDILITCLNSGVQASAGAVTRANLLVDFGVPITSRQDGEIKAAYGRPSEILLLVNDPGANNGPVAQYGQNAPVSVCTAKEAQADVAAIIAGNAGAGNLAAATNCPQYLQATVNVGGNQAYWELDSAGTAAPGGNPTSPSNPCLPGTNCGGGQAKNAFQGGIGGSTSSVTIPWSANQVMFFGVPVYPALAGNQLNFFRIVNVRVTPGSAVSVSATLSPTTLTVPNGNPVAGSSYAYTLTGTPQVATFGSGLTTSVSAVGGVSLCAGTALQPFGTNMAKANLAMLSFKENAALVFKPRSLSLSSAQAAWAEATAPQPAQNIPNGSYTVVNGTKQITVTQGMSESGFVTSFTSNGATLAAGQADQGTRLKAVFANLDPNVAYYVTNYPVIDYATPVTITATNPLTGGAWNNMNSPGDATQVGFAVLQSRGTLSNGSAAVEPGNASGGGYAPAAIDANATTALGPAVARLLLVKQTNGTYSAEAVWEVTNVNPGTPQTFNFAVYGVFDVTSPVTTPQAGNLATVQLGFAPTTASSGDASKALPRFLAPGSSAVKFDNILPCQTSLLFPFVTGVAGYNTGLAISNTSADPYGTATSQGTCSLAFFSGLQPAVATTPTVAPGTSYTTLLGSTNQLNDGASSPLTLTGFSGVGYMIATCNFQFAHGFAFVAYGSPSTAGYAAMGYVAPVITGTARGLSSEGESLGL